MIPAVASTHWPSSKWRQISLAFICRTPRRKDEKDEKGEKREGSQRKNVLRISLRGNIIVQECENDGYWSRHGNGCSTAASQRGVLWIKSATEVTSQRHTLGLESRGVWFIRRQKVSGRCCYCHLEIEDTPESLQWCCLLWSLLRPLYDWCLIPLSSWYSWIEVAHKHRQPPGPCSSIVFLESVTHWGNKMVALHDATDRATHEFAATAISGPWGMLIDLRSGRSGNHISSWTCCQGPLLQASESKAQSVPTWVKSWQQSRHPELSWFDSYTSHILIQSYIIYIYVCVCVASVREDMEGRGFKCFGARVTCYTCRARNLHGCVA